MEKISIGNINKKIENNKRILLIVSTEWCGQCKMAKLLIEKLIPQYPKISFFEIDADDNNLWNNEPFNIMQVPTFITYKDKQILSSNFGYQMEEHLKNFLDKLL